MTWPLDVFYASVEDVNAMRTTEAGAENKKRKTDELNRRAKARARGADSPWWSKA